MTEQDPLIQSNKGGVPSPAVSLSRRAPKATHSSRSATCFAIYVQGTTPSTKRLKAQHTTKRSDMNNIDLKPAGSEPAEKEAAKPLVPLDETRSEASLQPEDLDLSTNQGATKEVSVVTPEAKDLAELSGDLEASSDPKKSKLQVNPEFEDLKETGKWGTVSRKEVIVAAIIVALVIMAAVVLVVVFVANQNDSNGSGPASTGQLEFSPTVSPTNGISSQDQLSFLREELASSSLMTEYLSLLPTDADMLVGLHEDTSQDPAVRGASWLIHVNSYDSVDELMVRFGLATLFYATGGESWTKSDGWLDPKESVCDSWYGVTCNIVSGEVDEVDLASNNLVGAVHKALTTIKSLRILWLNDNLLSGPIPGNIFASLDHLFILYLQNNNFQGMIPEDLIGNGVLATVFLHGNNLTGVWPPSFCGVVREFRLGCLQTPCPERCCNPEINCFD